MITSSYATEISSFLLNHLHYATFLSNESYLNRDAQDKHGDNPSKFPDKPDAEKY
jgi:hypothetical protein